MKKILPTILIGLFATLQSCAAEPAPGPKFAVLAEFAKAMEARDPVALAACFTADYRSEQPLHPARAFRGADKVREHWVQVFKMVPDLRQETVRVAYNGDTAWQEFRWVGHSGDGSAFEVCGVMLFGVSSGKIAWGRLYFGPPEKGGDDIDAAIKHRAK
jgi:ketosteroid isomerase-like protein